MIEDRPAAWHGIAINGGRENVRLDHRDSATTIDLLHSGHDLAIDYAAIARNWIRVDAPPVLRARRQT
ncbi:MAG: hypothetical protein ACYCZB_04815 [Acidiphilium sp.]